MESLQEILMDAYREGREDEVKTALEKRREVKKTGKGSREELHNAKFSSVAEEAEAALKMSRGKRKGRLADDWVGEAPEEAPAGDMPEAFSIFRAMKDLMMKKNQAYHY